MLNWVEKFFQWVGVAQARSGAMGVSSRVEVGVGNERRD